MIYGSLKAEAGWNRGREGVSRGGQEMNYARMNYDERQCT